MAEGVLEIDRHGFGDQRYWYRFPGVEMMRLP
jgi:hypothetical protein